MVRMYALINKTLANPMFGYSYFFRCSDLTSTFERGIAHHNPKFGSGSTTQILLYASSKNQSVPKIMIETMVLPFKAHLKKHRKILGGRAVSSGGELGTAETLA